MYIVENQAFSFSGALHLVEIRDENRLFFIFKHCYRSFSEMYTVAMHEPKHLECFENEMAVVPNIHLIGIEIFKMWVVKYEKKKNFVLLVSVSNWFLVLVIVLHSKFQTNSFQNTNKSLASMAVFVLCIIIFRTSL